MQSLGWLRQSNSPTNLEHGNGAIRLVIAGGDAATRLALRAAVDRTGRFDVVGEADDSAGAAGLVALVHPDQLLLDAGSSNDGGFEGLGEIRAQSPGTRVLVYAGEPAPGDLIFARQLGADGLIRRSAPSADVVAALLQLDHEQRRRSREHDEAVTDGSGLVVLDESECLARLAAVPIGRVAVSIGALPAVFPVNFVLLDRSVLFFTAEGTKLDAAARNAVVAFQADEFDVVDRSGWSVMAVGMATEITDATVRAEAVGAGLAPWAEGARTHLVGVAAEFLSGRLIFSERGRWE